MVFENVYYFGDDFRFHPGNVEVEDGRIVSIEGVSYAENYLIPGLIDIHTHGNMGFDFSDGNYNEFLVMAEYLARNGITSFLAASMTLPESVLNNAYRTAVKLHNNRPKGLAKLVGINMEGPFFANEFKGAQDPRHIRLPDIEMFSRLNAAAEGLIKIVCIAPEIEGAHAFIRAASEYAAVSVAHTAADYDAATEAFAHGASHVTHLFNAMQPMMHRAPGVVGAAADNRNVTVELISDGTHLHESTVRMAFQLFGDDRIVLISDAVRGCGGGALADLSYTEEGKLTGSITNLYDCMRKAISFGIAPHAAVQAATANPARVLNIKDQVGTVAVGKLADLVLCDYSFRILNVYLDGHRI